MLSFLSDARVRANQEMVFQASRSLVGADSASRQGSTDLDERDAYFSALNVLQEAVLPLPHSGRPEVRLQAHDQMAMSLLSVLGLNQNWADSASADELREVREHVDAALCQVQLAGASVHGDFFSAVVGMIAVVVFAGDFFGGGMSEGHNLGLVCLGMGERRQEEVVHFAETLVHETTHQALFLEDMLYRVFTDEARVSVSASPLQAYSTTRSTVRPYDVAFHAACVTATLEMYRSVAGRAESSEDADVVSADLEHSVRDLERLRGQALTPAGSAILDELIDLI